MLGKPQPIDVKRDSAFQMTIGTEGEGPISGFISIGERRTLILKRQATYEVIAADAIDPDRTNIMIPNSQRKLLNVGTESAILGQTLLTADALLKAEFLSKHFDRSVALDAALVAAEHLLAMNDESVRARRDIEATKASVGDGPLDTGFMLPSLVDRKSRCAAFVQRSHHFIKSLLDIVRILEGNGIRGPNTLLTLAEAEETPDKHYLEFLRAAVPHLESLWLMRNAIEHPKPDIRVRIENFRLLPSGMLSAPTIDLVHPTAPIPEMPIEVFFEHSTHSLGLIFEEMLAHLCQRHLEMGNFQMRVVQVPVERRRNRHVRFGRQIRLSDGWILA